MILAPSSAGWARSSSTVTNGAVAAVDPTAITLSPDDRDALTRVAYAEAGDQGAEGIAAVVYTVLNRAASGRFQNSVEAVISAPHQFEPVARAGGWRNLPQPSSVHLVEFHALLASIQSRQLRDPTGGALYFQNRDIVAARAATGLVPAALIDFGGSRAIAVIGDHHFYRDIRFGGVAAGPGDQRPPAAQWGVVLGAYPQDFRALRAIELMRAAQGLAPNVGHPAAIPLKDGKFYGAVLAGLNEDVATATCLSLRRRGAYCVTLAPAQLRDPGADWRG